MSREHITTEFGSADKWNKESGKFGKETTSIYARYEYPEAAERERKFAEMIGVPDTAIFNAGMGAIYTAIEAEELKPGDVVLCGKDVYGLTKDMYKSLEKRGIKIEMCDSGNMEEIEKMVDEKKPRLIILESVANSSIMQVCDVKKLSEIAGETTKRYKENFTAEKLIDGYFSKRGDDGMEKTKALLVSGVAEFKQGNNPFVFREAIREFEKATGLDRSEAIREISREIKFVLGNSREKLSLIIDNTLTSPALYNPVKDLEESGAEAVIVESATKHYQKGQDKITMGIVYSIKAIKAKRSELGTYLQPNDEKEIPEDIIKAMPEIMKHHAENALKLAGLINSSGKVLEVSHPNLPEHKQNNLAKEIAPEGLVTLFYMKIKDAPGFVNKIKEIGGEKIGIGGSFGHPKTWLFNLGEETVRIAAGSESKKEFQEVLNIFKKALENYGKS
jgi:cystathionine beta-lyase/cystathionine gamma-synthase